jgi:hypothetical protein
MIRSAGIGVGLLLGLCLQAGATASMICGAEDNNIQFYLHGAGIGQGLHLSSVAAQLKRYEHEFERNYPEQFAYQMWNEPDELRFHVPLGSLAFGPHSIPVEFHVRVHVLLVGSDDEYNRESLVGSYLISTGGRHYFDVKDVEYGDVLNMRAGATSSASIIGTIPPSGIGIFGPGCGPENQWCFINYQGTEGWVARRYLIASDPERYLHIGRVECSWGY